MDTTRSTRKGGRLPVIGWGCDPTSSITGGIHDWHVRFTHGHHPLPQLRPGNAGDDRTAEARPEDSLSGLRKDPRNRCGAVPRGREVRAGIPEPAPANARQVRQVAGAIAPAPDFVARSGSRTETTSGRLPLRRLAQD